MTRRGFLSLAAQVAATLDRGKLAQAEDLIDNYARDGRLRAASLLVEHGQTRYEKVFGTATPGALFLLASITKPMTATGVMTLADRGKLKIEDPASRYLPNSTEGDRARITIRHLLTHTSGLPDMLPENTELRRQHAPLSEFVARTLTTPLLFAPGSKMSYSSMGILLAANIAERIDGRPLPKLLDQDVYKPLAMSHTALGLGEFAMSEIVKCQTEFADPGLGSGADAASWDWNSDYWRRLATPWGGAHSNARDVARFLRSFLDPAGKPLKKATAGQMIQDHNKGLSTPWGLGWGLGNSFGKGCSAATFGHGGSTGTLCWADPKKNLILVLLTSLPERVSRQTIRVPVSDLISEAV